MQVAHPVVGAGVADHSDFLDDRWGRLLRTMESTFAFLGYRGEERGRAETDRLREIHKGIKGVDAAGRRYHALNPEAYLWVHATLYHGMVETQRVFGRPLGPVKEAALFGEWRDLALALGITERHLPRSPAAFRAYFDAMVRDRLERNATVDLPARAVRAPLDHRRPAPLRRLRAQRPARGRGDARTPALLPRRPPRHAPGPARGRRLESAAR